MACPNLSYIISTANRKLIESIQEIPKDTEKIFFQASYISVPKRYNSREIVAKLESTNDREEWLKIWKSFGLMRVYMFTSDPRTAKFYTHLEAVINADKLSLAKKAKFIAENGYAKCLFS